MNRAAALLLLLLVVGCHPYDQYQKFPDDAATVDGSSLAGQIIYSNCAAESCTGAGSNNGWTRTVETSGCYSGSCLKLVGTLNTNPNATGYGAGNTSIGTMNIFGHTEITISSWVKLSKDGNSLQDGNLMQTTISVGPTQTWASETAPNFGADYHMTRVIGTVRPASWFKMVTATGNPAYPQDNGDGTYYSWKGYIKGTIQPEGPPGVGTSWVNFTKWIKLPSTATATDGAVKVWLGNELLLDIWDAKMKDDDAGTSFTRMAWYPNSAAGEPFEHWMDEMVVYQGYVPPR